MHEPESVTLLFTGHRYIELFLRSQPDSGGSQGWGGSGGGSNFGGGNSGGKYITVSFDTWVYRKFKDSS